MNNSTIIFRRARREGGYRVNSQLLIKLDEKCSTLRDQQTSPKYDSRTISHEFQCLHIVEHVISRQFQTLSKRDAGWAINAGRIVGAATNVVS